MKKMTALVLLVTLFHVAFGQAPATKFTITGYTSKAPGKVVLLLYTNKSQFVPYDSTEIKDGKFIFSGILDEPKSFSLQIRNKSRILFVGNENMVVTDKSATTGEILVTGSALTNDYDYYFERWIAPLMMQLEAINKRLNALDITHQREIDSLTSIQSSLFKYVPDSSAVFIREKPSSFVSLYLLNYYGDAYKVDELRLLFNRLAYKLKEYPSADFIKEKLLLEGHQSKVCPKFSVRDANNQSITLETFAGDYLLIEFWASWCLPCVKNIPLIQGVAEQYRNQNFKVLTVSLDNSSNAWKSAIAKYKLDTTCTNVLLLNGFRDSMAVQFNISYIPYNILIDPKGNIIERDLESDKLNQTLKNLFAVTTSGEDVANNL